MLKVFLVLVLYVSTLSAQKKHEHREHHAHVHGTGELSIAFDQTQGTIELRAPAEAIVGFEHEARSEKHKKLLSDAISQIEMNIAKYVQFEAANKCGFQKDKIAMVVEKGGHANFVISYKVTCHKSPRGGALTIDFTAFKKLRDIDVVVLVDDLQKSVEVKSKPTVIVLE